MTASASSPMSPSSAPASAPSRSAPDGGVSVVAEPGPRQCTNHPDRETYVACGRCERPFCPDCLIHTVAGQRCYECAGVRRDFAQRAFARRLGQVFGIALLGGGIASLLGSILFVVLVAVVTGGAAGQSLSPLVNRRTRRLVYLVGLVALVVGAYGGWLIPLLLRTSALPVPLDVRLFALAPAVLQNLSFWVFTGLAAALGYQRVR